MSYIATCLYQEFADITFAFNVVIFADLYDDKK